VSSDVQAQAAARSEHEAVEAVLALIRENGGRATPARRLLLQALFGSQEHRTAEELAAEVRAHAPDVHLSTVYRNLEELERLGVIDSTRQQYGFAINTHRFAVTGRCANCQETAAPALH
jgi:Fe2+ or Zn2+ uptake regulation protein